MGRWSGDPLTIDEVDFALINVITLFVIASIARAISGEGTFEEAADFTDSKSAVTDWTGARFTAIRMLDKFVFHGSKLLEILMLMESANSKEFFGKFWFPAATD